MKNLNSVNVSNLLNTEILTFNKFMPELYTNWIDVYFEGQRIAIINGMQSPLQWTAKNGSNIPYQLIEDLTNYCSKNIIHN